MRKRIKHIWVDSLKSDTCYISEGNEYYVGVATCANEDLDMCSRLTGESLSERRAYIAYYRGKKKKLKAELKTLKDLYSNLSCSHRFDETSYEAKMIKKHIYIKQKEITEIEGYIKILETFVSETISLKDKLYQKIRAERKAKEK